MAVIKGKFVTGCFQLVERIIRRKVKAEAIQSTVSLMFKTPRANVLTLFRPNPNYPETQPPWRQSQTARITTSAAAAQASWV